MLGILYNYQWLRFKPSLGYFLLSCFLLPLLLHLFIGFPFRYVFNDINGMNYMFWMIPGNFIILSCLMAYTVTIINMNNFMVYPKSIDNICKTPVSNFQILFSVIIWAFTIGIIQWLISIIVVSLLINEFYSLLVSIRLALQTLVIIPFFSVLSILTFLISNNQFWKMTASLFYFIFLSFGLGCLIPLNTFPEEVYKFIKLIPITGVINGSQNIIMGKPGSFTSGLFIIILTGILFIICLIISNKKFKQ